MLFSRSEPLRRMKGQLVRNELVCGRRALYYIHGSRLESMIKTTITSLSVESFWSEIQNRVLRE